MQRNQRDGAILILLSVAGYSCFSIFTKILLARGEQPVNIAFWRYLFTLVIFWALVLFRRVRTPVRTSTPLPRLRLLLLGTLFAGEALVAFFGFEKLPAATFTVLFYSYPAIVAILEAFLGERLSPVAWLALVLTLIGIVLTAPDFSAGLGGGSLLGVVLALLDAFQVAVYFLLSSRLMRGHPDMLETSAWTVTGAFIVLVVIGLVTNGLALPQPDSWLLVLAMAVIGTVLPVFALNAGIQKLGSTRAAIIATFEPVLTAILALTFLGEMLLPTQWLGGAIIIASVILLQLRRPFAEDTEQTALARE